MLSRKPITNGSSLKKTLLVGTLLIAVSVLANPLPMFDNGANESDKYIPLQISANPDEQKLGNAFSLSDLLATTIPEQHKHVAKGKNLAFSFYVSKFHQVKKRLGELRDAIQAAIENASGAAEVSAALVEAEDVVKTALEKCATETEKGGMFYYSDSEGEDGETTFGKPVEKDD